MILRRDKIKILIGVLLGTLVCVYFATSANAQTGSIYLSSSTGRAIVGQTFSIVARVNTSGTAINAVEGSIVFDPQKVEVVSISKSNSILSIWASEPSFSNSEGTIEFTGGLFNPGYSGSNGLIMTITFRAKSATTVRGYTEIVIVSGAILANDGVGTNILSSLGKATYYIGAASAEPVPPASKITPITPTATAIPVSDGTSFIKSSTHPDSKKWYSNNNPEFNWALSDSTQEVRLILSRKSQFLPIISYIPPISEKRLDNLENGVWYLHGQLRTETGLGPVASFKFQIDTEKPGDFIIKRLDTDSTNPQPELVFGSRDEVSGIDRYEIKIGDGDWFKILPDIVQESYKLPIQFPGSRNIIIRVFDKANNYSEADYKLEVKSIEPPKINPIEKPSIKVGENIVITGKTKPFQKVKVIIKINPTFIFETVSDANGDWKIDYHPELKGQYELFSYTVDERGAVSNESEHKIFNVESKSIFELVLTIAAAAAGTFLKGFDIIVRFIMNSWLNILATLFIINIIYVVITRLVPIVKREIQKINYIIGEYSFGRKLKNKSGHIRFDLKMITEDIKDELALLKKIGDHRNLHPDEQYLKDKLEKYLNILKNMK